VVDEHGDRFGVEPICRVLGYKSASTVYARRSRPPSARQLRDQDILAEIQQVRTGHAACYGARRTWVELRRRQVQVARCTVERIMRSHGLVGVQRGREEPRHPVPRHYCYLKLSGRKKNRRPAGHQTLGSRQLHRW
jgi:transposase InsO family protein